MLILCSTLVLSIDAGTNHIVKTIDTCYGDTIVKIKPMYNMQENEYNFMNCNLDKHDKFWYFYNCSCNQYGKTEIILQTKDYTKNEYDIVIQFDLKKPLDSNNIEYTPNQIDLENLKYVRTFNFNDLQVGPAPKEKFNWSMPDVGSISTVFIIILFAIVCVFALVMYLYSLFFKSQDNDIQGNTYVHGEITNKVYEKDKPKNMDQDIKNILDEIEDKKQ